MDFLFPVSGVEAPLWLPPLTALVISFVTSMAGVSGAFLLLPFQMSVLGFDTPAVTPTNQVYNITATPSGIYRYLREGRLVWPLAFILIIGTVPGGVIGGFLRITVLSDPAPFKAFVGFVLLYIAWRSFQNVIRSRRAASPAPGAASEHTDWSAETISFTWKRLSFRFQGEVYSCSTISVAAFSLLVGIVGGAYGIGGAALIGPVLVSMYGLPIYAVAGASLTGTFGAAVVGVLFFQLVAPHFSPAGMAVRPDWLLGLLFGLGGIVGMYLGARCQRFVPAVWLKLMLTAVIFFVAGRYLMGFWSH